MRAFMTKIAAERLVGGRPSAARSIAAAAAVGAAAAGIAYRVLRHQRES